MNNLVGITGFAHSGKDSAAQALVDNAHFEKISFADPIRHLLYELNSYVIGLGPLRKLIDVMGWEDAKRLVPEVRDLMKTLGNEMRALDPDVWVNAAMRRLPPRTVISDVRFLNEAMAIRKRRGVVVRITRPGVEAESEFEAESAEIPANVVVVNDGSIDLLRWEMVRAVSDLPAPKREAVWPLDFVESIYRKQRDPMSRVDV